MIQADYERAMLIEHRDGIWWYKAPLPPVDHVCEPWTVAVLQDVERCACGAMRFRHGLGSGSWGGVNERRFGRKL